MIPEVIVENKIFKEIVDLANSKGITLKFEIFDGTDQYNIGLAYTQFNNKNKTISIHISKEYLNNESVLFHELFHAKLYLIGFPGVYLLPNLSINSEFNKIISSVVNILQHKFVYQNMKDIGKDQLEFDNEFFHFFERELSKNSYGLGKITTTINLFDTYVRNPLRAGSYISKYNLHDTPELDLYYVMREVLNKITSPLEMRNAICDIYKSIDKYVYRETQEDLRLNLITAVSPVLFETQINEKASKYFKVLGIQESEYSIVLDIKSNHCCAFINSQITKIDLEKYSVLEFLRINKIHYSLIN